MSVNLVFRSIGRVLWFAVAGAVCLTLCSFYFYIWILWKDETLYFPGNNYLLVVVISFSCGTFYGAIVGAKREIARQKLAGLENL